MRKSSRTLFAGLNIARIKKAYRRKALELHPDRNFGNVENATELFAELQTAYEVLSDPQERAWYDTHRDSVLRGEAAASEDHYERDVRFTTASDITKLYLNFDGRLEYSDGPQGFFTIMRTLFNNLANEERIFCESDGRDPPVYPSFGYTKDTYDDGVKQFYSAWSNFSTEKSFAWRDAFKYGDAADRRTRRIMEKENKKLREDGIREFNGAVRALVAFIKKRDPRYIPNVQTDAERHQKLREHAAAQAAKSRAANKARLAEDVIPDWAKSEDPEDSRDSAQVEEDSEDGYQELFECIVCRKSFKSEKQFKAHENSKKHLKTVYSLQKRMRRENASLGLGEANNHSSPASQVGENGVITAADSESKELEEEGEEDAVAGESIEEGPYLDSTATDTEAATDKGVEDSGSDMVNDDDEDEDDDYASRDQVTGRISGQPEQEADAYQQPGTDEDIEKLIDHVSLGSKEGKSQPKIGKAKAKRAKKIARESEAAPREQTFRCAACQATFPSKTKLFNHVRDLGHAQPVLKPSKGKRGSKR